MDGDALAVLDGQHRCLLAVHGRTGPLVSPMAYWWDDQHAWMTTAASAVKIARLRADPRCAVWVPGPEGSGVGASGVARVFDASDPVGLLLHGPAITGAMTALAASNVSAIAGYVQDAARVPSRFRPHNRVVLRVRLDDAELCREPVAPPGVAPALPTVVPAEVRRVVGGRRRVVVALDTPDLEVLPAVWGAGFALTPPAGRTLPADAGAAVVVDVDPGERPTTVVGLALRGTITDGGALRPARATWWEGFEIASADVPAPTSAASGIVLPD